MKLTDMLPGTPVRWVPRQVPGWDHADTVSNEFTLADQRPHQLSEAAWDAYLEWSEKQATGTVVSTPADDDLLVVLLDRSPLVNSYVAYQRDEETAAVFEVAVNA